MRDGNKICRDVMRDANIVLMYGNDVMGSIAMRGLTAEACSL
jgi:hypothetical protein